MTIFEMQHDQERMIQLHKRSHSLSHPDEAEILTTLHKWMNEGLVGQISMVNYGVDLPQFISSMEHAIEEKHIIQGATA